MTRGDLAIAILAVAVIGCDTKSDWEAANELASKIREKQIAELAVRLDDAFARGDWANAKELARQRKEAGSYTAELNDMIKIIDDHLAEKARLEGVLAGIEAANDLPEDLDWTDADRLLKIWNQIRLVRKTDDIYEDALKVVGKLEGCRKSIVRSAQKQDKAVGVAQAPVLCGGQLVRDARENSWASVPEVRLYPNTKDQLLIRNLFDRRKDSLPDRISSKDDWFRSFIKDLLVDSHVFAECENLGFRKIHVVVENVTFTYALKPRSRPKIGYHENFNELSRLGLTTPLSL